MNSCKMNNQVWPPSAWTNFYMHALEDEPEATSVRKLLSAPEMISTVEAALARIRRNMQEAYTLNGCREITYATRAPRSKYPTMKVNGRSIYCHTLLAIEWCWNNGISLPWPDDWSVSHNCGNRLCGTHISVQPHSRNQARECCPNPLECRICKISIEACSCDPPCAKPIKTGICSNCNRQLH